MTTTITQGSIEAIRAFHNKVKANIGTALDQISEATIAGWECGKLLLAEKAKCKQGEWLLWLESNCPEINERTAQRYMDRASKYDTLSDLQAHYQQVEWFKSLGLLPDAEVKTKGASTPVPSLDEGMEWIQRACQYFHTHDLTKLNDVGRRTWKERLKPLVELYERL